MAALPISFNVETIRAIHAGSIVQVRRPVGLLMRCESRDRLWVREPFHLDAAHDSLAPLQSLTLGGRVRAYAADLRPAAGDALPPGIGRRRFARELPRAAHRSHLVISNVEQRRLQELTDADARREGAIDRADFARRWDNLHAPAGRSVTGDLIRWQDNPRVTVLTFDFVAAPLKERAS